MASATRITAYVLTALLLSAGLLPAQIGKANAKVRRAGSGAVEEHKGITILEDGYEGLKARKGPRSWNWPVDRIVDVRYLQAPESYRKGLEAFDEGSYREAVPLMRDALEAGSKHVWMVAYGNWYAAEAARRLGLYPDATTHYNAVLEKAPKSRFYPKALAALADIEMIRGKGPAAQLWFKKLLDFARRRKLPEVVSSRAEVGLASVEARFGDAKKGLEQLKTILAGAPSGEIQNRARLEIGQCHIRLVDYGQAKTYFQGILDSLDKDNPDSELIAGATNGLGDCQWKLKEYEQAGMTFSRVYSLFFERTDMRSEVAWALYMGGKAFQAQGAQSDDDKKKLLNRRARSLWRRAIKEFAGTRGEALARKELGN